MDKMKISRSMREANEAQGLELKPGSFYWVQPTWDVDCDDESGKPALPGQWPFVPQPARFIGYNDAGEERWDWLNGGDEDWPPCWHGPEITLPEANR